MSTIINNTGYLLTPDQQAAIRKAMADYGVDSVTVTFKGHETIAEIYSEDGDLLFSVDMIGDESGTPIIY
jgi:hypothetical protein